MSNPPADDAPDWIPITHAGLDMDELVQERVVERPHVWYRLVLRNLPSVLQKTATFCIPLIGYFEGIPSEYLCFSHNLRSACVTVGNASGVEIYANDPRCAT